MEAAPLLERFCKACASWSLLVAPNRRKAGHTGAHPARGRAPLPCAPPAPSCVRVPHVPAHHVSFCHVHPRSLSGPCSALSGHCLLAPFCCNRDSKRHSNKQQATASCPVSVLPVQVPSAAAEVCHHADIVGTVCGETCGAGDGG